MLLSVIVPIYNEEKYIKRCIETILAQDFPREEMEVVFVDGMSTDKTREIVLGYVEKYNHLSLLDNVKRTAPCAMNIGIRATTGELVMRLDGHSLYPTNYFSSIVLWHKKIPEALNVGGLCITDVVDKNKISMSIAKVMSDKFGVGNSKFRTGVGNVECIEVDTVPFGCYKREVFDLIGYYNEELTRSQDYEFNKRLRREGGKIYMIPNIHCTYIPRDNYQDLCRNRYQTGYWVVKMGFITGTLKNSSIRHFIPLIFVLSIIIPSIVGLLYPCMLNISIVVLLLYMIVMLFRSIVIKDKSTTAYNILIAFSCLHFSYGLGSLIGVLNNIFKRERNKCISLKK